MCGIYGHTARELRGMYCIWHTCMVGGVQVPGEHSGGAGNLSSGDVACWDAW